MILPVTSFGFPVFSGLFGVEQLGWLLVHSIWQFAMVALIAGLVVRFMKRCAPSSRYIFLVIAMCTVALFPLATMNLQLRVASQASQSLAAIPIVSPTQNEAKLQEVADLASESRISNFRSQDSIEGQRLWGFPLLKTIQSLVSPWLPSIVIAWVAGVAFFAMRPILGWRAIWRLRTANLMPVSEELLVLLQRLSKKLGIRNTIKLYQSSLVQVPMVFGYLRPMVLLPASLLGNIPISQLEAILAHELEHIRRHDFVVNLVQTILETLFFYHPAVWWLSRRIRIERELCCDDAVVKQLNNRLEYGRALVAIAQLRGSASVFALGASDGSLLSRIERITGANVNAHRTRWSTVSQLTCLAVALTFGMTFSWQSHAEADYSQPTNQLIARLSGETTVEVIGLADMTDNPAQWWSPHGELLTNVPTHVNSSFKQSVPGEKRAIVRITGIDNLEDASTSEFGVKTDFARLVVGKDSLFEVRVLPSGDNQTGHIEVGVVAGPYSEIQQIPVQSSEETTSTADDTEIDTATSMIKVLDIFTSTKNGERAEGSENEYTAIKFRPHAASFDTDMTLIDRQAARHSAVSQSSSINATSSEIILVFPVHFKDAVHFEYRNRRYQYRVVFANLSLDPTGQTQATFAIHENESMTPTEQESLQSLEAAIKYWRTTVTQKRERITNLIKSIKGFDPFKAPSELEIHGRQLQELSKAKADLVADIAVINARMKVENSVVNRDIDRYVNSDPDVQALREKIADRTAKRNEFKAHEESPTYKRFTHEIDSLKQESLVLMRRVAERAEEEIQRLQETRLKQELDDLNAKLVETEKQLVELKASFTDVSNGTAELYFAKQDYEQAAEVLNDLDKRMAAMKTEERRALLNGSGNFDEDRSPAPENEK